MTDKNTKECVHCFTEIDARATVCPNCRQPQSGSVTAPQQVKPAKKSSRAPLLLVVILTVCGCLSAIAIYAAGQGTERAASDNQEPESTAPPAPTAPPIEEILQAAAGMTDAQRNAYNESIAGSRVEGWRGEVADVNEGEVFGGFTVYVEMVADNFGADVFIEVEEDVALQLQKGSTIVFSGDVKSVSDILGTGVFIENATIETVQ